MSGYLLEKIFLVHCLLFVYFNISSLADGSWLLATGSFNRRDAFPFFIKLPKARGQKPEAD
jgi:hypothetical protein